MKRLLKCLIVVLLLMLLTALLVAFSMSPGSVEFEVPADGSTTHTFSVYDFNGDLKVSLEDLPLRVEPTIVSVSADSRGTNIELTFYGDESLGSHIYKGYVRFLASSGGNIATGIKVRATVTHLVEGETPVPVQYKEMSTELPLATKKEDQIDTVSSIHPSTAIIIAAGLVFLGLIVLSITLLVRKKLS